MAQEIDREIKDLCFRLYNLLDQPEYGLFTWQQMRVDVARQLSDKLNEVLYPNPEVIRNTFSSD